MHEIFDSFCAMPQKHSTQWPSWTKWYKSYPRGIRLEKEFLCWRSVHFLVHRDCCSTNNAFLTIKTPTILLYLLVGCDLKPLLIARWCWKWLQKSHRQRKRIVSCPPQSQRLPLRMAEHANWWRFQSCADTFGGEKPYRAKGYNSVAILL